ncbi:MAG: alpha/beta fold hydrolase [Gammaproteobacteria bacterium]|jgi:esterase/lipase
MARLRTLWHTIFSVEQLAERHRCSGLNSTFQSDARSVEEYIAEWRRRVAAARTDLGTPSRLDIVDGNCPFVLRPDGPGKPSRGILLVHGLSDSAFLVRDIAEFFRRQGFYVFAIVLPGHGTRPGDLLQIGWQDWLQAHQHALDLLAGEVEDIYLLGFSAGAALNIYQALHHRAIKALFLFAPALRVRRIAGLACPLSRLGRIWKRFNWLDLQPDDDPFKYESLSNRAICEAYRLVRSVRRLRSETRLQTPVFVVASENDVTVDSRATLEWFGQLRTAPKRMLLYSTGKPAVPDGVRLVACHLPEQGIQSFSHTALLQSPDNPHYGAEGRYRFCVHYYVLDQQKYRRCKAGQEDCLGEMFQETHDCQVVRRLTYNPFYDQMLGELRAFLELLEAGEGGEGNAQPRGRAEGRTGETEKPLINSRLRETK